MDVCVGVLYTYYEPARSVRRQGLDARRGGHIGYAFVQYLVRNGEAYHFYLIMIDLFPHNLTAYESAVEMLAETGKAAIIHPTGTGKSFIAFKLCEDNEDKRVLWLSPSEYIFKTQIENLKAVSDGYCPKNIIFYTYAKLMYMSESEIAEIKPAYIVLDEFHRCGAEVWGKGVQNVLSAYTTIPVLGLSATNIRYLDNQRDMADELFDGNVASEMTLGEAIVRGILNPPKYVLSVFQYQKDLDKYAYRVRHAKSKAVRDSGEKYLEALRRALGKADGLPEIFNKHIPNQNGKYIVFCANVEHMDDMVSHVQEWFGGIDSAPHVYKAYADDPDTSKAFADFKKDDSEHLKLLFCIDMLNEGVHVEDISGVILLRPTVSPIIYKQQIGRALSASKITNAVIFDIVMNIDNLYSIGTIQDEMQVVMTYYRERGLENEIVNSSFKVIDEVRDCIELFEKLNDTLVASWDYMFDEAKKYYEQHGDLEVPTKYKTEQGYSLGHWLATQRKVRRGEQFGILGENRIAKLDSIGMVWDSYKDLSWKKNYAAAKEYYAEHGDLRIPATYTTEMGIKLGAWITNLRNYRKNGAQSNYLTEERIAALDEIGMVWDVPDMLWERNYAAARDYYAKHGNLDVSISYVTSDGIKLGIILCNLRNAYRGTNKSYKLTQSQIDGLNEIGMIWTPRFDRAWEKGYAYLQTYYEENGNADVPTMYVANDGYRLGAWACDQRERVDKITDERKARLDSLGFVWNKEKSWDKAFAVALDFYTEHGHLNVPYSYRVNGIWLNKWLNEQKQIYNGNRGTRTLTGEQITKLESIGICWELGSKRRIDAAWEEMYAEAERFYVVNKHLNIPGEYRTVSGKKLQIWIIRQRKAYKSGELMQEQVQKLERIGMAWQFDDPWEVGFTHAKEYAVEHGDLLVLHNYICNDGYKLGNWIANQRNNKDSTDRYRRLSIEQIERLDSIGMVWNVAEYAWTRGYEQALRYWQENGHLRVPRGTRINGVDLQSWVCEQRKSFKKGKLSQEKILKLVDIGVIVLPDVRIENRSRKAVASV